MPRLVVAGEPRHGVVAYAIELADGVGELTGEARALGAGRPTRDVAALAAGAGPLHLHFTDRLWGSSPEEAAGRIEQLAAVAPLTVTLHDLPQPSDGPERMARRADAYRRVIAVARALVLSSHHEVALLAEHVTGGGDHAAGAYGGARQAGRTPPPTAVIALPVRVEPAADPRPPSDGSVALLGFVYPGKGHAEVIDAVASLAASAEVVALGRASPGHEPDVEALAARAATLGVAFAATGYLEAAALLDRARRVAVAVAAHQHVSASGSIATWIGAGRRPLVPDTRYSREIDALRPGTVTRYPPNGLRDAIAHALADPDSTWCEQGTDSGPDLAAVAAEHLAWWAQAPW